jgi:hypothetical protein
MVFPLSATALAGKILQKAFIKMRGFNPIIIAGAARGYCHLIIRTAKQFNSFGVEAGGGAIPVRTAKQNANNHKNRLLAFLFYSFWRLFGDLFHKKEKCTSKKYILLKCMTAFKTMLSASIWEQRYIFSGIFKKITLLY